MNITIGAKCWDGMRSKSLSEILKVEIVESKTRFMDKLKSGKWLSDPKVKMFIGYAIPIVLLLHGVPAFGLGHAFASSVGVDHSITVPYVANAVPAMAAASGVQSKILHAFDPLIHMIQSLAYPIAGVMIAGGCLFIMVGNKERGMQMLQNAALGYILVQLAPTILQMLVGVGSSM